MPLSANTLFHLTKTKESLKKILEESFRIYYCKETVLLKDDDPSTFYVPMVSFCDIPLSEIKEHISKYGEYGIGLTKEWGKNNKLNPVLYLSTSSQLAESYEDAYHHFIDEDAIISSMPDGDKSLINLLRYIKNYEGDLHRKDTVIHDYRFSDEREWRFVPPFSEDCPMIVSTDDYTKDSCNKHLDGMRLKFEPNDISYIIIKNDTEITEFINHLRQVKGHKYSYFDVDRLSTRILTVDQIMHDV